jgi:cell division FtsZ-interacting protein ZapD
MFVFGVQILGLFGILYWLHCRTKRRDKSVHALYQAQVDSLLQARIKNIDLKLATTEHDYQVARSKFYAKYIDAPASIQIDELERIHSVSKETGD